jgi:hypothetical protein
VASQRPASTRLTWTLLAAVAVASLTGTAGCDLRGLAHDQLYGSPDAGPMPDLAGPDDQADARPPGDASPADISDSEIASADAADGSDTATPDAAGGDMDGSGADLAADAAGEAGDTSGDTLAPCTVDSCAADQFCEDVSGRCILRTGTGMLSGAVTDACNHTVVDAKIGIAGRRQCSAAQKGSYFFSELPLGKLTVTAAAPGYDLFVGVVTIVPGGNVMEVPLVRTSPVGCADPKPAPVVCTCVENGCS